MQLIIHEMKYEITDTKQKLLQEIINEIFALFEIHLWQTADDTVIQNINFNLLKSQVIVNEIITGNKTETIHIADCKKGSIKK